MNAIRVIAPYKDKGTWVFDDAAAGLTREPFIAGMDTMLDLLVVQIPAADRGFTLLFSDTLFPGHTAKLEWRREDMGGNWYWCPQFQMEGWLCPALYRYFTETPHELYFQARSQNRTA